MIFHELNSKDFILIRYFQTYLNFIYENNLIFNLSFLIFIL
jgi:hypothetical protein